MVKYEDVIRDLSFPSADPIIKSMAAIIPPQEAKLFWACEKTNDSDGTRHYEFLVVSEYTIVDATHIHGIIHNRPKSAQFKRSSSNEEEPSTDLMVQTVL